ncbi:tail assembly protein [Rodentibacter pneumotropicus]|uniref:Tail assembly protein n=1 Tax=Rodentibacter pneumotropicus TaxID=758 RepID=A0AAW5LDA7_9PAST|nr:tail assembly protein [Rodentibacter pneumotropicus]MCQ9121562.1 tail assembly protein [Rodentibacter pneumotropicus]
MVKVRFYGALKQFGTEFNLEVNNTAEIVRALTSQIPNLRQFLQQGLFKVRIGKDYLDSRYLEKGMFYQLKEKMVVSFTPVLKGSKKAGLFQTIVGAVMVVVGYAMSWTGVGAVVGNLGVGLLLGGVSQMLTKMPSMPGIGNEKEKKNSTAFSNLSNMVAQGKPMPLAYGRIRTGSLIISQGVETLDASI